MRQYVVFVLLSLMLLGLSGAEVKKETSKLSLPSQIHHLHHLHEHEEEYVNIQEMQKNPFYYMTVEERLMPYKFFSDEKMLVPFLLVLLKLSLLPLGGTFLLWFLKGWSRGW